MMNIKEFMDYVAENVKEYLPPAFENASVTVNEVYKNNDTVLHGILIRNEGEDVTPQIYLDKLYADMKSATKMRKTLSNLARISEKYECAIVLIGHMTKSNGGKHLYRGLGSIDIAAIARSVLMISRDEENPSIRYFFQVKNSIAPEGCAVAFIMDPICGFQWIGRCSGINALESAYDFNFEQKSKLEKAKELLKVALSLQPMKSKDVLNRLKKIDISERTIRKAVKELNIKSYQSKRVWYWKLPDEGMEGNEKE